MSKHLSNCMLLYANKIGFYQLTLYDLLYSYLLYDVNYLALSTCIQNNSFTGQNILSSSAKQPYKMKHTKQKGTIMVFSKTGLFPETIRLQTEQLSSLL